MCWPEKQFHSPSILHNNLHQAIASLSAERGHLQDILRVGGVIQRLLVPDANGQALDIVLGYDDWRTYRVTPTFAVHTTGLFG